MKGFPQQDEGPGMKELFHDLQVEQEEQKKQKPVQICSSCGLPYMDGDTCPAIRGGCPMGGDF